MPPIGVRTADNIAIGLDIESSFLTDLKTVYLTTLRDGFNLVGDAVFSGVELLLPLTILGGLGGGSTPSSGSNIIPLPFSWA